MAWLAAFTKETKKFIAGCVKSFFRYLDADEIEQISQWDYFPYPSDIVSNLNAYWNPYYWTRNGKRKQWDERWYNKIYCCIQTGLEIVSKERSEAEYFSMLDKPNTGEEIVGKVIPDKQVDFKPAWPALTSLSDFLNQAARLASEGDLTAHEAFQEALIAAENNSDWRKHQNEIVPIATLLSGMLAETNRRRLRLIKRSKG